MKDFNRRTALIDPILFGYPEADSGSTTRYAANVGYGPGALVGSGFTIEQAKTFSWAANGPTQKQGIWVPPGDIVLVSASIRIVSMTTDGSVPATIGFNIRLGDAALATSGSITQFCAATVDTADLGWSGGTWATGLVRVNSTTWSAPALPNFDGSDTRGWRFGTFPVVHSAINHDRFYLDAAALGGTPAGQNLTAIVTATLTGYLV